MTVQTITSPHIYTDGDYTTVLTTNLTSLHTYIFSCLSSSSHELAKPNPLKVVHKFTIILNTAFASSSSTSAVSIAQWNNTAVRYSFSHSKHGARHAHVRTHR